MIKQQIYMHLNIVDTKKEIFFVFRVFVLTPIPKNKNSEITEIHQKPQNTETWECNFKSPWNTIQMTSSQNDSVTLLIIYHIFVSRASDPWRSVKLSLFVYFSFNAMKVEIVIEKHIHMHLNFIDLKIKFFRDFWVFVLSSVPKNENSEIKKMP